MFMYMYILYMYMYILYMYMYNVQVCKCNSQVFEYQSVVRNAGFTNHFPVHEMSCTAKLRYDTLCNGKIRIMFYIFSTLAVLPIIHTTNIIWCPVIMKAVYVYGILILAAGQLCIRYSAHVP